MSHTDILHAIADAPTTWVGPVWRQERGIAEEEINFMIASGELQRHPEHPENVCIAPNVVERVRATLAAEESPAVTRKGVKRPRKTSTIKEPPAAKGNGTGDEAAVKDNGVAPSSDDVFVEPAAGSTTNPPESPAEAETPGKATVNFADYAYVLAGDGPGELIDLSLRLLKKPGDEFFWVDNRPEMYRDLALCPIRAGFNDEFYGVSRLVQEELGRRRVHLYRIRACYGRDTGLFLWALRMANPVFISNWHSSAWTIAEKAEQMWLMMEVDEPGTGYVPRASNAKPPWKPPTPTAKSIDELIALALGDRWINDSEHPILKHRRGEI